MTDQWLQFARFLYKKRGRRVCNLRYLLVVFHWKPFTAIAENNCDTIILSVECFVFKLAFVVARHSPVTFHMFVQRTSKLSLDINGKGYTKPPRCRHTINSISFFLSYRCSLRSHWILHNGVCDGWSTGDAERGGDGTTLLLHKTFKRHHSAWARYICCELAIEVSTYIGKLDYMLYCPTHGPSITIFTARQHLLLMSLYLHENCS